MGDGIVRVGLSRTLAAVLCAAGLSLAPAAAQADDRAGLVSVDHYVRVKSTAASMAGQVAQVYVREVTAAGPALRGRPGRR